MREALPLLLVAVFGACGEGAQDETPNMASDTMPGTARDGAEASASATRPTFDPGTLDLGDTVHGLTVVAVDVARALEDSLWIGEVALEGDLVLHGVYQQHPDWPRVEMPCLHAVQSASIERLPGFSQDEVPGVDERTWFCFGNADLAFELLGMPEPPREVVVALDRYVVRRDLADAFDTGRLAEVIEVGPVADATLLR